jgi:hypothetical protein
LRTPWVRSGERKLLHSIVAVAFRKNVAHTVLNVNQEGAKGRTFFRALLLQVH